MSASTPPTRNHSGQTVRRPVTAVTLGALLAAAAVSALICSTALRRGGPVPGPDLALRDLLPGIPDDTITWGLPGAGYPAWHGLVMATILIGVPATTALPLLARGHARLVLLGASTFLVWSFALLTISRTGLLYVPAACLLLAALALASEEQRDLEAPA